MVSRLQVIHYALKGVKQCRFTIAASAAAHNPEFGGKLREILCETNEVGLCVGIKDELPLSSLYFVSVCSSKQVEGILWSEVEPKTGRRSQPRCDCRRQFLDALHIYL